MLSIEILYAQQTKKNKEQFHFWEYLTIPVNVAIHELINLCGTYSKLFIWKNVASAHEVIPLDFEIIAKVHIELEDSSIHTRKSIEKPLDYYHCICIPQKMKCLFVECKSKKLRCIVTSIPFDHFNNR